MKIFHISGKCFDGSPFFFLKIFGSMMPWIYLFPENKKILLKIWKCMKKVFLNKNFVKMGDKKRRRNIREIKWVEPQNKTMSCSPYSPLKILWDLSLTDSRILFLWIKKLVYSNSLFFKKKKKKFNFLSIWKERC